MFIPSVLYVREAEKSTAVAALSEINVPDPPTPAEAAAILAKYTVSIPCSGERSKP